MMNFLELEETDSTNTYAAIHAAELPDMTFIQARRQTAGRGQRGNSWESEPGRNITFSLLHFPADFPARRQFFLSEAFSLAVVDALADFGVEAMVKWPNDIYVEGKKICGILIEHALLGTGITRTIFGAGINVNQATFVSDAPNPVSMIQLLGCPTDLKRMRESLAHHIKKRLANIESEICGDRAELPSIHAEYMSKLWRGNGKHLFRDVATGERFYARITDVEPMGHLILQPDNVPERRYAFKEVEFCL